jgi:hypothetical protein
MDEANHQRCHRAGSRRYFGTTDNNNIDDEYDYDGNTHADYGYERPLGGRH